MIDAVCAYGSGYKGPNFNQLRGPLLAKCVAETRNFVDGFRRTWRETGCTIMADGWTDRKRRTLINFLVYCPKGTIFSSQLMPLIVPKLLIFYSDCLEML